jgi:hypothetical protein
MTLILTWIESLHQTRHGTLATDVVTGRALRRASGPLPLEGPTTITAPSTDLLADALTEILGG